MLTLFDFFFFFFLQSKLVFLEEAADHLLGRGPENKAKCKVRRLYDISNILNSLGLVEKTFVSDTGLGRRTAFRWIGVDVQDLPTDPAKGS